MSLRVRSSLAEAPTFPPLLSGHRVEAGLSPFAAAVAAAETGGAGAGDLFWNDDAETFQVSVVLEPECPERQALQMLFVAMVAFADSFGAVGPPEIGIFYQWPNGLRVSGASIGRARIATGSGGSAGVPAWLVVGIEVRVMPFGGKAEPGHDLLRTSLWDEGAGDLDRVLLIESFSRHFLTWVHNWSEDGFKPVYGAWIGRAIGHGEQCEIKWQGKVHAGTFLAIDENGQMLLKGKAQTVALGLAPVVERGSRG